MSDPEHDRLSLPRYAPKSRTDVATLARQQAATMKSVIERDRSWGFSYNSGFADMTADRLIALADEIDRLRMELAAARRTPQRGRVRAEEMNHDATRHQPP